MPSNGRWDLIWRLKVNLDKWSLLYVHIVGIVMLPIQTATKISRKEEVERHLYYG